MDSLLGTFSDHHTESVNHINAYLKKEAQARAGVDVNIELHPTKAIVPSQGNSFDCGIYLICFFEWLLKNPEDSLPEFEVLVFLTF